MQSGQRIKVSDRRKAAMLARRETSPSQGKAGCLNLPTNPLATRELGRVFIKKTRRVMGYPLDAYLEMQMRSG